ncbi:DNA-3-methyladenine glycosylase family protein [Clostridium polynesiense]|uniref:DNA-3-methyladenine glycosylase family protein n=1 Tax=Clostridium polynesiense TaxID=1325933 RepID=UPI0006941942|nr:DNA glycosylase [Clostridium polynesiense]
MDFKAAESFEGGVILKEVKNFELNHTFDCGQCFRWEKQKNGNYIGTVYGRVIELEKKDEDIIIYNTNMEDFNSLWINYFDLNRDYSSIKEELSKDPLLKEAVAYGHGIRILQQDPFEITLSFIISARNSIPIIMRTIKNLSRTYGKPIEYKGETYYAFPEIEELRGLEVTDYEACGASFRSKYLKDTVEKISNAEDIIKDMEQEKSHFIMDPEALEEVLKYDLNRIKELNDEECHTALQNFSGIGPKVADCIALFSMKKYSSFPVDVWVKRAMQFFYLAPDVSLPKIRIFGRNKFGELSGFAQQYLFYYARENNINIDDEPLVNNLSETSNPLEF